MLLERGKPHSAYTVKCSFLKRTLDFFPSSVTKMHLSAVLVRIHHEVGWTTARWC